MTARRLVLGVGNRHRGDDAVGLLVIDALRQLVPPGVQVEALDGAPVELSCHWSRADAVVLVDAISSGAAAGTVRRFDARAASLPADLFAVSTHALGVAQGIELARALDRLPGRLIVYGVEGQDFTPGAPPSGPVAAAVAQVARRVLAELEQEGSTPACTNTASSGS